MASHRHGFPSELGNCAECSLVHPPMQCLSYYDVKLTHEDINLLLGPQWLNDRVIAFYYEYLSREVFLESRLLLVSGSEAFLLANLGPEGSAVVLEPRGFPSAQLTLFACNDNPDVEQAEGGSHWSLLVYSAFDNTFRHYDSMRGSNAAAAKRLYQASRQPGSKLIEQPTPQQQNSYDCGIMVLALTGLLCARHAEHGSRMSFDVSPGAVTPAHAADLRQQLYSLIHTKASKNTVT